MTSESFGPYRLLSLIGRGGMGEVWRAVDTRHNDRVVAVKRLPAELATDPTFRARFQREAAVAASLADPHVIPIHHYGEIDGRLFIDMRLIEGSDLAHLLRERGTPRPEVAVDVIGQVATALDEAHRRGLLHRDVKPSNLLVTGDLDRPFTYLIDFGIARTAEGTRLTNAGTTTGTLAYMAPESFEGRADHRADIYALGCVLHETLTGFPAMYGESAPSYMRAHMLGPIPRPSQVRPGLPPALDAVIATGLAKDPQQRYQTAGDLAHAARAALAPAVTPPPAVRPPAYAPTLLGAPTPPPPSPSAPPRARRSVWPIVAAAVAVAALVVGVVVAVTRSSGSGGVVTTTAAAPTTSTTTVAPTPTAATKPTGASVGLTGAYATLFDKLQDTGGVDWNTCTPYPEGQDADSAQAIECRTVAPALDYQVVFYVLNTPAAYASQRAANQGAAKNDNCAASGFGGTASFNWAPTAQGFVSCYQLEKEPGDYHVTWGSPTALVLASISDTSASRVYSWWASHANTVPS